MLPTQMYCPACKLDVKGHPQLHALDLGGQFTHTVQTDPADYYDIDQEISGVDVEWDAYGND